MERSVFAFDRSGTDKLTSQFRSGTLHVWILSIITFSYMVLVQIHAFCWMLEFYLIHFLLFIFFDLMLATFSSFFLNSCFLFSYFVGWLIDVRSGFFSWNFMKFNIWGCVRVKCIVHFVSCHSVPFHFLFDLPSLNIGSIETPYLNGKGCLPLSHYDIFPFKDWQS